MSESSNSFRFTKPIQSATFLMKEIISFFFSGRSGSSIPVFCLPKIFWACLIFSISSCIRFLSGLIRNDG